MHTVQLGMWDPRPPSKHASPLPTPPPSSSRPTHVTTATPAKRITFYRSGDNQFGGVRMAVHKRSFKCFDALLDDLSQKVPLPFGVRTVTTPRGTHTIKHLEQLQDGGCYLCSDRRHAKPVNIELASKRPNIWYHHSRRPQRPDTSSTTPPGHLHLPYRQRRILLIKNSEPGLRRSIVLSRRSTRSLGAFLDEVSEVMQFHVRKLYTAEGRRIDNVQSLMTCPGVLVCVGREAFSPMLVNFIRKSSEEKLPGLGSRSPGLGPRTPGNGSIIHPRSDSSNRSTRFSLSSEKSYGNGVSAGSQARPAITNDDIEKRVLVNKDGSLSVEMRVRFRLQNDETIQWSTQIKKSPSLTNECCPLSQAQPHYLQQGQSESCSDPDSTSFDPESMDYPSQPLQCVMETEHCPCCYQRQEQQYDLWKNPVHSHHHQHPVPPPHTSSHSHTMMRHTHSSSSSSSCNSRRVVRCRARVSNRDSGSEQSQLVQEEMCVTEQVEHTVEVEQNGGTHIEVCKVSRCCSQSEVVAVDSNIRPISREDEGERPFSAVSSSSHVLQALKEDQDDEDDDLPPSTSNCCHSNEPPRSPASNVSANSTEHKGKERGSRAVSASSCNCGAASPRSAAGADEMDRVPSSASKASEAKIPKSDEDGAADDEDEEIKRAVSGLSGHTGVSASSQKSGASSVCSNCGGCKRGVNAESNSRASQRSSRSNRASPNPASPLPSRETANNTSEDAGSDVSTQSNKTNLTNHGRLSAISNVMEGRQSRPVSRTSSPESTEKEEERPPSATSATSHRSNKSNNSGVAAEKEEERSPSAVSAQSNLSAKSGKSHKCTSEAPDISSREEAEGGNTAERAVSSLSAKSGASAKTGASVKSHKSSCQSSTKAASPTDNTAVAEDDTNKRAPSSLSVKSNVSAKSGKVERPDSVVSAKSAKSNVSGKSATSNKSTCSHCAKAASPGGKAADEPITEETEKGEEAEERPTSAISAKSNLSAKSNKSQKSAKASERSLSPRSEGGQDGEVRATSQMSGGSVKSNKSAKSTKSSNSKCNGNEIAASPSLKVTEEVEGNRPESIMSAKSEKEERAASARSSRSHKCNCNGNTGASPEIGDGDKAEERAASALSGKSASSAKSHKAPSAMSGRSHISAKSSKSQRSNHTAASPNPNDSDENQERVASAMSVKTKSSVKSGTSHKNLTNPNVVTIKTPEEADEEGDETKERAPSAASGKSSASSHKSNHKGTANIAVIETADGDEETVDDEPPKSKSPELSHGQTLSPRRTPSPRTHSPKSPAASHKSSKTPVQQLLPGPGARESRGPSALSVHSTVSAKSGRSKCHCGANKEKEGEDKEAEKTKENEDGKSEGASGRESRGTEQPLSRNSSGSVSLGLPEDQETADSDSGKSSVSVSRNTDSEVQGQVKTATPDVPKSPKEDGDRTGSTVSQKSNGNSRKSASSHNPPAVDIPTIETPGGGEEEGEEGGEQNTERTASAVSVKSSRSQKSCCNCSGKTAAQTLTSKSKEKHANATKAGSDAETQSVKSVSTTNASNLDAPNKRNSSAMSSASAKVRSKSPASASAKNSNVVKITAADSASNDNETQNISRPASEAKGKEDVVENNKAASVRSKSPCSLRPESAASAPSESKIKASKQSKESDNGSVKMKEAPIKSSSPCPLHGSRPGSKVETCSESTLSQPLSAADLLKETMAAARPHSQQSKVSKVSDKSRSKKSGKSHRSRNLKDQEALLELTPACLPNASPNEVVSDWLQSIPANMLAMGDEFNEEEDEPRVTETPADDVAKEESPEDEKVDKEGSVGPEEEDKNEDEAKCGAAQKEESPDAAPGDAQETSCHSNALLLSSEPLPKNWHSSAAVMKVLLSSSLGRCRSLPEVILFYITHMMIFNTSARGLLDCLAQLQLIEPAVSPADQNKARNQQYEDIMAILHSLWLTEPRDIDPKDGKPEQVTPPRSSSGVDMSSGSGGSGKDNGNQGGDETPPKETESLHGDEAVEKAGEEVDTAEDSVQCEEQSAAPQSLDSPKATENPSSSDKSSGNEGSKSPTDNERETLEGSSSGTPPTVLRAPLAKRLSQDPDPVWVLHLLKKLEKQFMNHYITAMAEFKVRWDLDDSLILDTMISELKDEVSRRIQSSIEREMRKIQGRAGRGGRSPRPPQGANLSRESTMTEKRRRMLKVIQLPILLT
uniref:Doublecortin domain-containing protein n=1 Tax=Stegastes partitus TaxID=144197 RepID=A0A3B5A9V6_9TELE